MLHFIGDFNEYDLSDRLRKYIPLFLKKKDDAVCYVPYMDDNLRKQRYVKFVQLAGEWVYADNSQES